MKNLFPHQNKIKRLNFFDKEDERSSHLKIIVFDNENLTKKHAMSECSFINNEFNIFVLTIRN